DPRAIAPVGEPLRGHDDWVRAVVFGRVGGLDLLATAGSDGTVRVWDASDPRAIAPVGQPLHGHTGTVTAVAFGRVGDIDLLATASFDGTVRVWDVSDPRAITLVGEPLRGHTGTVMAVVFGRVGGLDLLATASFDGTVRVWDVSDPRAITLVGEPLRGHTGTVTAVAFGRVGDIALLATASDDETVRVWDASDPRAITPLGEPLRGHTDTVWAVVFGRVGDLDLLATAGTDRTARVWDITSIVHAAGMDDEDTSMDDGAQSLAVDDPMIMHILLPDPPTTHDLAPPAALTNHHAETAITAARTRLHEHDNLVRAALSTPPRTGHPTAPSAVATDDIHDTLKLWNHLLTRANQLANAVDQRDPHTIVDPTALVDLWQTYEQLRAQAPHLSRSGVLPPAPKIFTTDLKPATTTPTPGPNRSMHTTPVTQDQADNPGRRAALVAAIASDPVLFTGPADLIRKHHLINQDEADAIVAALLAHALSNTPAPHRYPDGIPNRDPKTAYEWISAIMPLRPIHPQQAHALTALLNTLARCWGL
ncbi:WD40 repeat domain-containing protein, partial [Micromonospora sp. NPDC023814]|uniref:WD40 repeat domain-containing protein n=1 Tax=Micromonospora sp. NPDC023814 TaxID=3154596 RepID=UPI0033EF7D16